MIEHRDMFFLMSSEEGVLKSSSACEEFMRCECKRMRVGKEHVNMLCNTYIGADIIQVTISVVGVEIFDCFWI